ncbi:nicotinate (nicotinamide) nucleotide adenylyltransferase [Alkalicoccobacillus porphyridii]|uniref:Probable nicotinate-nucleotide adenylyltransferase n=1 Tax=Alkalicoccobacillus porphyridii TaxID=2597270 RepID=A0A554A0J7_9BACI|nr:nicotinate (nicotinamide) nucleotide adenylyltransferase [Alkalicoccobacillus porphyridii]TSB47208.1 nicotinate (nicotinamide) nucleotide adenylyltransferase [Alkalicoccobacillus porphyridii]
MKIGVYGSSFDPVTNVHLWTASTIFHRKKLDKVLFLPSSNKRRDKNLNICDHHRIEMVKLAIKDDPRFELSTEEIYAPLGRQYTYFTMQILKETYPNDELFFVMGADLLENIGQGSWVQGDKLLEENQFIVMARDGIDMLKTIAQSPILRNVDDGRFQLVDKGLAMEISSTYIREEFSRGGEPRYLLPESCYQYIKEHRLYQEIE